MKNRPKPDKRRHSYSTILPDCLCCAFVLLEDTRLKRSQGRFAGLYAGYRAWHPPANRQFVMHHTDELVDES